jgi:endonuclease/exonuclease/phosphatase (EEP) superfamily protein YafD
MSGRPSGRPFFVRSIANQSLYSPVTAIKTKSDPANSRVATITLWCVALPVGFVAGTGWMLSARVYLLDLLVSHQMFLSWLCVFILGLTVILRRWRCTAIIFVLMLCALWPLVAGRSLSLPKPDLTTKPDRVLRVVSCNIYPENAEWEQALTDLMMIGADVIVLLEVPAELSRAIRHRGWLEGTSYPSVVFRPPIAGEVSQGIILSPFELRENPEIDPHQDPNIRIVELQHPEMQIHVGLMHPHSPRNSARWRSGNEVVQSQADSVRLHGIERVVYGVDLNSAPAQTRSRMLRTAGLRQSKPLFRAGGTYPAESPAPGLLSIQIDDIWSKGLTPIAWQRVRVAGSDHFAVVTDLVLD